MEKTTETLLKNTLKKESLSVSIELTEFRKWGPFTYSKVGGMGNIISFQIWPFKSAIQFAWHIKNDSKK